MQDFAALVLTVFRVYGGTDGHSIMGSKFTGVYPLWGSDNTLCFRLCFEHTRDLIFFGTRSDERCVAKRLRRGGGRLHGALDTSMPRSLEMVHLTPVTTSSNKSGSDT